MSKKPDSFLGWLGRQVGFVSKAIKADVTKPPPQQEQPDVVYRADTVEEAPHPADPSLVLRRTTTDEVIRDAADAKQKNQE
jgi:hypothetical protein